MEKRDSQREKPRPDPTRINVNSEIVDHRFANANMVDLPTTAEHTRNGDRERGSLARHALLSKTGKKKRRAKDTVEKRSRAKATTPEVGAGRAERGSC